MHRERAALSEIDIVQVHLEDLILRDPALQDERHVLFGELAASVFFGVRKKFFTSCCVIVLPPTRYFFSPRRFVITAPTVRIRSTPGWS